MSNNVSITPKVGGLDEDTLLPLSYENPTVEQIFFNHVEKEGNDKILHFSGVKLTKVPSQD